MICDTFRDPYLRITINRKDARARGGAKLVAKNLAYPCYLAA